MSDWQTMESVPHNEWILVARYGSIYPSIARLINFEGKMVWDAGMDGVQPHWTYDLWMPLPVVLGSAV